MRNMFKAVVRFIGLIILVLLGVIGLLRLSMQSYSSLNAGIKVAQICAYPTPASPPKTYVHLALYDNDNHISSENHYQVPGNQVQLQGDIIKYWPKLNTVLQPGYKLTRLEGSYNNEPDYKPDPILLNGGDDNLYKTVHWLPTVTPAVTAIVEAGYDKPLILMADGHTYDIIVSQDGLSALKVNGPLACGLNPQSTPLPAPNS